LEKALNIIITINNTKLTEKLKNIENENGLF